MMRWTLTGQNYKTIINNNMTEVEMLTKLWKLLINKREYDTSEDMSDYKKSRIKTIYISLIDNKEFETKRRCKKHIRNLIKELNL